MSSYTEKIKAILSIAKQQPLPETEHQIDELEKQLLAEKNFLSLSNLYVNRAMFYFSVGLSIKSLNYIFEKRAFVIQHGSPMDILNLRLGMVVLADTLAGYKENFYDYMMEFKEQALKLDAPGIVMNCIYNLGFHFYFLKDYDQAENYYLECITYSESLAPPFNIKDSTYLRTLLELAEIYIIKGRLHEAHLYIKKYEEYSLPQFEPLNMLASRQKLLLAKAQGNIPLATDYANELMSYSFEKNESIILEKHFNTLIDHFEQLNDLNTAAQLLERKHMLMDQLASNSIIQHSIMSFYELKKEALQNELYEDSLTGVLNRTGFEEKVTQFLAHSYSTWQLFSMIDLDYFKQINDEYGHFIGDEVLKEICKRTNGYLTQYQVNYKTIFGRYGGDEFFYYSEANAVTDLLSLADGLYDAITAEPFHYNDITFTLSISFGAVYAKGRYSFEQWLKEADAVLYGVKANGRGHLHYIELK